MGKKVGVPVTPEEQEALDKRCVERGERIDLALRDMGCTYLGLYPEKFGGHDQFVKYLAPNGKLIVVHEIKGERGGIEILAPISDDPTIDGTLAAVRALTQN